MNGVAEIVWTHCMDGLAPFARPLQEIARCEQPMFRRQSISPYGRRSLPFYIPVGTEEPMHASLTGRTLVGTDRVFDTLPQCRSGDDFIQHVATYIRQLSPTSRVEVAQFFIVQPQQAEDSSMDVADGDGFGIKALTIESP
jgi:hypothetical protein